jgi:NTP pyrophosphatase (non-canonical NTP hydrolase)
MVTLLEFQEQVTRTDRRPAREKTRVAVLGVFGELGSLMSEFKKRAREGAQYTSYNSSLVEEAGDLLWYFTALANDLGVTLDELLSDAWRESITGETTFAALARLPAVPSSKLIGNVGYGQLFGRPTL